MSLTQERLREVVFELAGRPRHEKVRVLLTELLVHELGVRSAEVDLEMPIKEVRGRADALLGRTIFEIKTDLRRERGDAEEQLHRYLTQREAETNAKYTGIATDGATFIAYELQAGALSQLAAFPVDKETPRSLTAWLDNAIAFQDGLEPDADTVRRELGKSSLTYARARRLLQDHWAKAQAIPEAQLKRQLWADLLEKVYGSRVESDELFLQHTYLTIVAKTMAVRVLGIPLPAAEDLLNGAPFEAASIEGAVESDFFDWILIASGGPDLVNRIAHQAARFRLERVETDVLKSLYESLIDPEQRHDLGEYYTPDWLASRVCERAIERPLEQRVLDPSCGSGTFLFHAVRRFLGAADSAGVDARDALSACCEKVLGIDIHPVAVIIARVTYLLALGEERLKNHPPLSIPVYLGDSLQWNTEPFMAERDVLIAVPEGPTLHFPASVAQNPGIFDAIVQGLADMSAQNYTTDGFRAWLLREHPLDEKETETIVATFEKLRQLYSEGRNHIWGYVSRNLSRPVWLSSGYQKVDVIVGNPPWLSYRYMTRSMQALFKKESQDRNLWEGGNVATHQDLSAYFFARCVELYLQTGGLIALVLPYAVLNRKQYTGFRKGKFGKRHQSQNLFANVRYIEAWTFDEDVQPLFPVPSCVLIAIPAEPGPLPKTVRAAEGDLVRRDASPEEAESALTWTTEPWPTEATFTGGSPYREAFRQGATMVPRVLCTVEVATGGLLGANAEAPLVESRRSSQEKEPWKSMAPMHGNVEAQFIRPLYLGESIAPFRLLSPVHSVIPWVQGHGVLDAQDSERLGYRHLASWLREAQSRWSANTKGSLTFKQQIDYLHKLSAQFPTPAVRVLFSKSGTVPAAIVLRNQQELVDHTLYWAAVQEAEGLFLEAILNSAVPLGRVAGKQARGQWGARHFDKLMFGLPIPKFDAKLPLHNELVSAALRAEAVAAAVTLPEGIAFTTARRRIREALAADGISAEIDALVEKLLGPAP